MVRAAARRRPKSWRAFEEDMETTASSRARGPSQPRTRHASDEPKPTRWRLRGMRRQSIDHAWHRARARSTGWIIRLRRLLVDVTGSSVHRRATSTTSRARTRAASYERIAGGPRIEMDDGHSARGIARSVGSRTNPAMAAARTSIRHDFGRSTLDVSSTAALASRITGMCRRSECSETSSVDVRLARSSSYLCAASCSVGRPSSTRATAVTKRNQRTRVLRKAAGRYQTGQCAASVVSVRRTARIGPSARFCS